MTDLSQIDKHAWNQAQQRADILRPLAKLKQCPRHLAHKAANQLKLSVRQVYTLIKRLRQNDGIVTTLLSKPPSGGRGKQRLSSILEARLRNLVDEIYLTQQKYSAAHFVKLVCNQLTKEGIHCPSESTMRRRLKSLPLLDLCKRDEFHPEATPVDGVTPPVEFPLDLVHK